MVMVDLFRRLLFVFCLPLCVVVLVWSLFVEFLILGGIYWLATGIDSLDTVYGKSGGLFGLYMRLFGIWW